MKRIWVVICAAAFVSTAFCGEPIDATNLDELKAQSGQDVVVEGLVTDIGTTQTKTITFINLRMLKKQGFVAVIFQLRGLPRWVRRLQGPEAARERETGSLPERAAGNRGALARADRNRQAGMTFPGVRVR